MIVCGPGLSHLVFRHTTYHRHCHHHCHHCHRQNVEIDTARFVWFHLSHCRELIISSGQNRDSHVNRGMSDAKCDALRGLLLPLFSFVHPPLIEQLLCCLLAVTTRWPPISILTNQPLSLLHLAASTVCKGKDTPSVSVNIGYCLEETIRLLKLPIRSPIHHIPKSSQLIIMICMDQDDDMMLVASVSNGYCLEVTIRQTPQATGQCISLQ